MSAKDLGEQLGRNKEYVDRRENGEYDYSPADLHLIAKVTGAPLEFLLHGAGWGAGTWQVSAKRAGQEIRERHARKRPARNQDRGEEGPGSEPTGNPAA